MSKKQELIEAAEHLLHWALRVVDHVPSGLMFMNSETWEITWTGDGLQEACERVAKALDIELVYYNHDGCEWNPDEGRPSKAGDKHNRDVQATVRLGSGRRERGLCESCSRLPRFSKLKKRVPIKRRAP